MRTLLLFLLLSPLFALSQSQPYIKITPKDSTLTGLTFIGDITWNNWDNPPIYKSKNNASMYKSPISMFKVPVKALIPYSIYIKDEHQVLLISMDRKKPNITLLLENATVLSDERVIYISEQ
jgi:hypothetical protein